LPDSPAEADLPYPDVPRVSLAETKAAAEAGTALIVDVRSQNDYNAGHIPTAISLPIDDLEARYGELPQDAEIITYCT
jgi:rhodanese-related sulfurtransferase